MPHLTGGDVRARLRVKSSPKASSEPAISAACADRASAVGVSVHPSADGSPRPHQKVERHIAVDSKGASILRGALLPTTRSYDRPPASSWLFRSGRTQSAVERSSSMTAKPPSSNVRGLLSCAWPRSRSPTSGSARAPRRDTWCQRGPARNQQGVNRSNQPVPLRRICRRPSLQQGSLRPPLVRKAAERTSVRWAPAAPECMYNTGESPYTIRHN